VETSVLGEVTDTGRLVIHHGGEEIVNVDPRTVAIDGPVYERPVAYPAWIDALQADSASALPRATEGAELREQFLTLVASPNLADTSYTTDQYDYYVGGNTALAFPDDAGMIRVDEKSGLGFAIATDANGRYCQLDPYEGARLALAGRPGQRQRKLGCAIAGDVGDRKETVRDQRDNCCNSTRSFVDHATEREPTAFCHPSALTHLLTTLRYINLNGEICQRS
jgi:phosphoribosylformylglycinamidine (FGAM) synthase-like enzyme